MKNLLISVLAMALLISTAEARRDQKREHNQQSRIKQGVQAGTLTHKEAKKLRKGQKRIDHMQVKANGDGVVTDKEKLKIEKAQDKQSELIYKQKHDDQNRKELPKQSADPAVPAVPAVPASPAGGN